MLKWAADIFDCLPKELWRTEYIVDRMEEMHVEYLNCSLDKSRMSTPIWTLIPLEWIFNQLNLYQIISTICFINTSTTLFKIGFLRIFSWYQVSSIPLERDFVFREHCVNNLFVEPSRRRNLEKYFCFRRLHHNEDQQINKTINGDAR